MSRIIAFYPENRDFKSLSRWSCAETAKFYISSRQAKTQIFVIVLIFLDKLKINMLIRFIKTLI